jgi:hypothetical protein
VRFVAVSRDVTIWLLTESERMTPLGSKVIGVVKANENKTRHDVRVAKTVEGTFIAQVSCSDL